MGWRYKHWEEETMPVMLPQYPIAPPFKSAILRKTNFSLFLSHHISKNPPIDELYHENSKLSPLFDSFITMENNAKNLKYLYMKEKSIEAFYNIGGIYRSFEEVNKKGRDILTPLKSLLPFFYGFYCVIFEKKFLLFKFEKPKYFLLVKELDLSFDTFLRENLYVFNSDKLESSALKSPFLVIFLYLNHFIVKHMFGVRGYRFAMVECGKLMEQFKNEIKKPELNVVTTSLFYDNSLNRFLGLDGRNFSVQGVIVIGEKCARKKI